MKNKKIKDLFIFFAVLMLLALLPLFLACGNENEHHLEPGEVISNGLRFKAVPGGYALASLYRYDENMGDVITVPSIVEGKPVVGLSGADESSIVGIILPDTITYIENSFEHCYNLTTLQIPASVTRITGSFEPNKSFGTIGCPKLVQIENGFAYVGDWLVYNVDLVDEDGKLVIPESVKHIGQLYWEGRPGRPVSGCIKELILPDSLETIGARAFFDCLDTKQSFTLKNVKSIGKEAFCSSNCGELIFSDALEYIGDRAFDWLHCNKLVLGAGIKTVGESVFDSAVIDEISLDYSGQIISIAGAMQVNTVRIRRGMAYGSNLTGIKKLILEKDVTEIKEENAFVISTLETVVIENKNISVPYTAFFRCENLKDVTAPADVLASIQKGKLERAHVTAGNVTVADFAYASKLKEVVLDEGVTVELGAFSASTVTAAIAPPALLSVLPKGTITSLTITDCTMLTPSMLEGFTALETVTLPATLREIEADTFLDITTLQNVYFGGTVADFAKINFANGAANPLYWAENLYVDGALVTEVKDLAWLSSFAFYGYEKLTAVSFSDMLTVIPEGAFFGCTGLASVEIPAGVREIGKNAFGGCEALTAAVFTVTENWCRYESKDTEGTPLQSVYFATPESAAQYLCIVYPDQIWMREN